jgi:GNAT superfamily N-acetyltransferase
MATLSITLRAARTQDLAQVDTLFAQSYPRLLRAHYPPSMFVTAVPLLARANPRLLASGTYLVAEAEDGRILGAGGWSRRPGKVAEVRHLLTDHRFLRQGIARRMLDIIVDEARRARARQLVAQSTLAAEPFYRAMGFAGSMTVNVPLRPGIDFTVVQMTRPL